MSQHFAMAGDGVRVPLDWFPAERSRCVLVFFPALGIESKLYKRLAEELVQHDCSVCLVEQRGHGRSDLKVRRGSRFGLAEFLDYDIPAALSWVGETAPGQPLILGGHSLGGHLSTIYSGMLPRRLQGILHIACGFPYYGDFPPRQSRLIRSLCASLPLWRMFPGYFPGNRLGFGGKESLTLMHDWSEWAQTGRFDFGERTGLAEAVSEFTGPVLSVSLQQDSFSCPAAVQRALSPFAPDQIRQTELGKKQQGDYLGHFAWARQPAGVVECIADWIESDVLHASSETSGN